MSIDPIEKQNNDVIVIGAGGAGLAAAAAAAQMGINVTVLEKLKHPGGNIMFAGGIFAAESHIQERNRIDARRDELFKIAMDYAHWRINPLIVRSFIDKSGDTIQWLEQMGLIFEDVHAVYPNQVPMVCHFPKGSGPSIVKVLVKKCEELGVKIQYQTIAKKLLLGESGKINGIIAEKDGEEHLTTARCVIIASGGYLGNRELLRKYCPSYDENMHHNGLPHMGEGITMAIGIGAATEGLGTLLAEGPRFDGPRLPRYMSSIADDPRTIWVNKKGERFIDEAASYSHGFESVNALFRQPGKVCYSIFDEKLLQEIAKNGPLFASRNTFFTEMEKESFSLAEIISNKVKGGAIKISDSWDDITDWIGADQHSFHDLIDEYNLFCECGYDKTFNKERRYLLPLRSPPYYALRCVAGLLTTIGGIKINHRMEVLDHNDNSIQGLYAAGTDTGGWVSETYCVRLTSSASSYAINSGRIAAESAVKYIISK